jgi:hypothetical protein
MQQKTAASIIAIVLLAFFVQTVNAITVYDHSYLTIPENNSYFVFSETTTLTSLRRIGSTLYINNYELSINGSNATITQFFENNKLKLNIGESSGTTIITVDATTNGYSRQPTASLNNIVPYTETFVDSTYVLNITHTSPLTVTITYFDLEFDVMYTSLFSNVFVTILLISIVPIIIVSSMIILAVKGVISTQIIIGAVISLIIYGVAIAIVLPVISALQGAV